MMLDPLTLVIAQQGRSLIDRLLGLRELSWSDPAAGLSFNYELPAWVWVLIILAAIGVAGMSYRRLLGARSWRIALSLVRAGIILILTVLLVGPVLVLPQETVERDWLLVMLDRSASMSVRDVYDPSTNATISRDEQLRRALVDHRAMWTDSGLTRDREVAWIGFSDSIYPVKPPWVESGLDQPLGRRTMIRSAMEQALHLPAGKPISSIILFSDGRTTQVTGPTLVQRLKREGVTVFTVPLGAADPPLDLAIGQAEGPHRAFINDSAPVSVTVDQLSGDPVPPQDIRVTLTDEKDGTLLDEAALAEALPGEPLRLFGRSKLVGTARWLVRVEHRPQDGSEPARELVTENNQQVVEVDIIDRPIRVLYVEGYPRWEFRYLKNLLIREKSVRVSTFLLSADRSFAQEGDDPITRLPATQEEWDRYDVVILGDVPASYFQPGQLTLLRDHVSASGAGLIWIAGESDLPRSYTGTPLADLLPMRRPADVSRAGIATSRFYLQPTRLARSMNVLQLRLFGSESISNDGWPEELPALRWVQDIRPLKPTAEVLAEATSEEETSDPVPALVLMRYGAGQSLYVATDESWRWRYGRGDWYFEQYWVPLVRMLGRARVQADRDRARLSVSHRQVMQDQAVVIELQLSDAALINRGLLRVDATVYDPTDLERQPIDTLTLLPVSQSRVDSPGPARKAVYRAVWRPMVSGTLVLTVTDPALADLELSETVRVISADDELADVRADHSRLRLLAEQTGGSMIQPQELAKLVDLVPNRARITETDIREPIGSSPLSMLVLCLLLTLEWVFRRAIRLA